jgi:predicted RNA binding protein YcfA (HicA-like mRNA interferase family)
LAGRLKKLDYEVTRQLGSHIRLSSRRSGEHHITIPDHNPLKIGTLSAILTEVASHHQMSKKELMSLLF